MACHLDVVLDRFQDGPRAAQEAPRPPQERPKTLPRGPQTPQERPRRVQEGLKRPQEPVKRALQLQRCPAKMPCHRKQGGHAKKWRASGGVPPKGQAIRRPQRSGGMNGVSDPSFLISNRNCRSLICLIYGHILIVYVSIAYSKSKLRREIGQIPNLRRFWRILTPLIFPPRAPRSPPDRRLGRVNGLLKSMKISIIFWTRFLIDFGPSWGAKLGSFWALLAAKIGQDRSKTCLGSLSTSKT